MQAVIEVLNEVRSRITVSEARDAAYLDRKYAIPVKNHFFNPEFTYGRWDGKFHFFKSHNGMTYTYLLPDIIDYLVRTGYAIDLIDNRAKNVQRFEPVDANMFAHVTYPDTGEPFIIAEHQLRCINALLEHSDGVIEAATGAGKSSMSGALCKRFQDAGLKTIIIVPSLDLIENTRDELVMLGLKDIGAYSGSEKSIDHSIVVSTWQTLRNTPFVMRQFNCVLVDETHGARGEELSKLLIDHGDHLIHRYGMTGTIPDDPCDAMKVHCALGPLRAVVTADELINLGWLASLDIEQLTLQEDLHTEFARHKASSIVSEAITYNEFKRKYFPDYKSESSYLSKNKLRQQWIADYIDQLRNNQGNTFVLVTSVDQGKKIAEMCPNAVFVHGTDKVKVRKKIYQLFKENNDMLVIATVGIASTGINIKRIFNLVLIDLGKSFIRTIQSIGRGLRKGADKDHLFVADICSDLKYSMKHANERKKYYKAKKYPVKVASIDYTNT